METFQSFTQSVPALSKSQLAFRIGLARKRTADYPMHKMDFILMDLERPEMSHRHADWCAGDLSGRVLEFLCCAEGIDGGCDPRLEELFTRILRTRRPSGLLGRLAPRPNTTEPPESNLNSPCHRLFNGLIKYHDLTGDWRALETAAGLGDWLVSRRDDWQKRYADWCGSCPIEYWITEPLAGLYRLTKEKKYLDFAKMIADSISIELTHTHTHGFLSTMRGLQLAAIYTGDPAWNEKPELFRRRIIDNRIEDADGCICECLPKASPRNEGCAIADWMMLNLNSAWITGKPEGYEKAENILWNALYFNQFVTGGFGHRDLSANGYLMGPMSECWWCCTENCGMGMTEYARHAVTQRGDTIWVNLLTPGRFMLRNIEVTVNTSYPSAAFTTVAVKNLPANMEVKIRIPECIKNPRIQEVRDEHGLTLILNGEVGHYFQKYGDKVLLRYGPAVLAPMIYYWKTGNHVIDPNIPAGYMPTNLLPGIPRFDAIGTKPNGFLNLRSDILPEWSYFETGPDAELSIEDASTYVSLVFEDGQKKDLWFSPLCHNTSDLTYYETPILFKE